MLTLTFILVLMAASSFEVPLGRLEVSIYYEADCPDSTAFFSKQFAPAYKVLGPYMKVKMIPFGKAKFWTEADGYHFSCSQGELGCYANEVHACALKRADSFEDSLRFITCAGRSNPSPKSYKKCCNKCGFDWVEVDRCARGDEGKNLLAECGRKTQTVIPHLTTVPVVVFNSKYNEFNNMMAISDLKAAVCKNLVPRPKVCEGPADMHWYK